MNNRGFGAIGERIAEEYLQKKGYKILSTNAIFAGCELDIVAFYSIKAQKKAIIKEYKKSKEISKKDLKFRLIGLENLLVFVEVKYSSSKVFGEPYERVTKAKQKQILKAAEVYLCKNNIQYPIRFDVISIIGEEINHIENAF